MARRSNNPDIIGGKPHKYSSRIADEIDIERNEQAARYPGNIGGRAAKSTLTRQQQRDLDRLAAIDANSKAATKRRQERSELRKKVRAEQSRQKRAAKLVMGETGGMPGADP